MNTLAISEILSKDSCTKNIFLGVFARDKLPEILTYPAALVLNNKNSNEEGEHWLAMYFNKHGKCTFFDSYGLSPTFYNLKNYLTKTSKGKFNYNMKRVQGKSEYCGLYCIFFLIYQCRNKIQQFFKMFTADLNKNDYHITQLLE